MTDREQLIRKHWTQWREILIAPLKKDGKVLSCPETRLRVLPAGLAEPFEPPLFFTRVFEWPAWRVMCEGIELETDPIKP